MKINLCFLQGLMLMDRVAIPLEIVGDENLITLKKGQGFDDWLTDETRIVMNDGPMGEVPAWVMNRKKLHEAVDAWLDGVEYEG